uniref:Transporter n=1 Tax=Caenorhabditis tropicalis TaxID=1561998 RepID=A0A1I7U8P7_9PELO
MSRRTQTTTTGLTTASTLKSLQPVREEETSKNPDIYLPDQFAKEQRVNRGRRAYKNYVEIENTNRQAFKGIESLLSSLGQAVGLGNIWRFPTMAYTNGGSSFLIPYIVCAFVFAIPAIHMEFVLGQYAAKSPPAVFRRIMPVLEGIGWMCCLVGAIIGVYYMILISWIGIYLANTVNAVRLSKCNNQWNRDLATTCYEGIMQKKCKVPHPIGVNMSALSINDTDKLMYFHGRCQLPENRTMKIATEQFFTNFVINPSSGFTDFSTINWATLAAVAICWVISSIVLIRGMKMIGKLSYFSVILPYGIIVILMIRGITLEGASDGLYYLWAVHDFKALYNYKAWTDALTQICFSLSIGQGGLMNIASYNKKDYNWYRDAYLLVICDTLMSLLGGTAVFATLGFLANQRGLQVPEVIKEGHALAFIVYTEAISQMPLPYLWHALFFIMLFLLGMSTEIVIVEIVCSCLADRFTYLRKHRWVTVLLVSLTFFSLGLVMTTDAGYYWFDLYDEYSAGVSATVGTVMMCVSVCWLYGLDDFRKDMTEMWGEAPNKVVKWLGPASYIWTIMWRFVTPICSIIAMFIIAWNRNYPFKEDPTKYPPLFDIIGWFVASLPFFAIPYFAITNILQFRRMNIPRGAFMVQKQHPAYDRISEGWPEWKKVIGDQLPDQEPGDDDIEFVHGDEEEGEHEQHSESSID